MVTLPDIRNVQVDGKTVLLRADLNVPFKGGAIADHSRIHRAAATINALLGRGARIVVMAHLDRPRGVANPVMSMAPVAGALADELNRDVRFVPDCVGAGAERRTRSIFWVAISSLCCSSGGRGFSSAWARRIACTSEAGR